MPDQFPYKRLPGRLMGFIRKASLWEGADHVLLITGTRFSEDYKRFAYRDIQALIVQKRVRSGSIGIWVAAPFACVLAISIAISLPAYKAIPWSIAGVLIALLLYRSIASLYFSCACYLQTAVSRQELPCLFRIWNARKALARLRANIEAAQGALPDDVSALHAPTTETASRSDNVAPVADARRALAGVLFALAACILLLVNGGISLAYLGKPLFAHPRSEYIWNIALTFLEGAASIASLLYIIRFRLLRPLRNLLFCLLGFVAVRSYFILIGSRSYSLRPDAMVMSSLPIAFRYWMLRADVAVAIVLSLTGIILILVNWQEYRRGDVSNA